MSLTIAPFTEADRATLHAFWDSRGIANAVCGDVEEHPEVTGTVVPADYELTGAFRFRTEGQNIVLQPEFPDLAVRIYVKPTEESWKVVERVVEERNATCRVALDKAKIQFRFEAINALNRAQFPAAGLGVTAASFGQVVTSAQQNYARRVQIQLKFIF